MSTSMNIHYAQSISYQRIQFRNFWTHRFIVTTTDGTIHEFDAFSNESNGLKLEMLPDEASHELRSAATADNDVEMAP